MAFICVLFGIFAGIAALMVLGLNPIGMFAALIAYILVSSTFYKLLRLEGQP
jgi:hypothetical protein